MLSSPPAPPPAPLPQEGAGVTNNGNQGRGPPESGETVEGQDAGSKDGNSSGGQADPFNVFNATGNHAPPGMPNMAQDTTLGRRDRDAFEAGQGLFGLDFNFPTVDHSALVHGQAQRRRLDAEDESTLSEFSQKPLGTQLILLCAMTLETAALVRTHTSAASYSISADLKKNITRYTMAFVLSPRTSKYMDGGVDSILSSLRLRGIAVPAASNHSHLDIVKSQIRTVLADKRNKMKTQIALALPPPKPAAAAEQAGSSTSTTGTEPSTTTAQPAKSAKGKAKKEKVYAVLDIATLCKHIVGESGVRVTIEMYYRVAYLRHVVVVCGSGEDYWNIVDERLKLVREQHRTPAAYDEYFKRWYDHDVSQYGAPARNGFVQRSQLDSWQITVETESQHAAGYSDGTQVPALPLA